MNTFKLWIFVWFAHITSWSICAVEDDSTTKDWDDWDYIDPNFEQQNRKNPTYEQIDLPQYECTTLDEPLPKPLEAPSKDSSSTDTQHSINEDIEAEDEKLPLKISGKTSSENVESLDYPNLSAINIFTDIPSPLPASLSLPTAPTLPTPSSSLDVFHRASGCLFSKVFPFLDGCSLLIPILIKVNPNEKSFYETIYLTKRPFNVQKQIASTLMDHIFSLIGSSMIPLKCVRYVETQKLKYEREKARKRRTIKGDFVLDNLENIQEPSKSALENDKSTFLSTSFSYSLEIKIPFFMLYASAIEIEDHLLTLIEKLLSIISPDLKNLRLIHQRSPLSLFKDRLFFRKIVVPLLTTAHPLLKRKDSQNHDKINRNLGALALRKYSAQECVENIDSYISSLFHENLIKEAVDLMGIPKACLGSLVPLLLNRTKEMNLEISERSKKVKSLFSREDLKVYEAFQSPASKVTFVCKLGKGSFGEASAYHVFMKDGREKLFTIKISIVPNKNDFLHPNSCLERESSSSSTTTDEDDQSSEYVSLKEDHFPQIYAEWSLFHEYMIAKKMGVHLNVLNIQCYFMAWPYQCRKSKVLYALPAIVYPYMESDLLKLINSENVSIERKIAWIFGIIKGLQHMHRAGVAHWDLKLENIFLENTLSNRAIIGDLGLAIDLDKMTYEPTSSTISYGGSTIPGTHQFGTVIYQPIPLNYYFPGIYKFTEGGKVAPTFKEDAFARDIWSLGLLCCELLTNKFFLDHEFKLVKDVYEYFFFQLATPEEIVLRNFLLQRNLYLSARSETGSRTEDINFFGTRRDRVRQFALGGPPDLEQAKLMMEQPRKESREEDDNFVAIPQTLESNWERFSFHDVKRPSKESCIMYKELEKVAGPEIAQFVISMLEFDPKERPSIDTLIQNNIFAKFI